MAAEPPVSSAVAPRVSDALDDVVRAARDVAEQRAALLRLEAGDAVARGLRAGALVLCAAICAGFVAAALWIAAVGAGAWWAAQRAGPGAAVAVVAGAHALLALGAWSGWRRSAASREAKEPT